MFPKSKRFNDKIASADIPGPGAYNVPINNPLAPWKKGAMLEKAERFKEGEEGPDTFGLYDLGDKANSKENKRPRVVSGGGVAPERVRMQLDEQKQRLVSAHEKDLARLQAKLQRAEAAAVAAKAELGQLKSDLRTSQAALASLTAQAAKTDANLKKHQLALPALHAKLNELTTSHASSHARKDAAIGSLGAEKAALESTLAKAQTDLATASAGLSTLQAELANTLEERDALREDNASLTSTIAAARTQLASAATFVSTLTATHSTALALSTSKTHSLSLEVIHLERQLGDKSAVITALGSYSAALSEQLLWCSSTLASTESDRAFVRHEWAWDRENRTNEKEWRQRSRSERRELELLRADLELEVDVGRSEAWIAQALRAQLELERREREREASVMRAELEVAEGELDLALAVEVPRLEREIERVEERSRQVEAERDEATLEASRASADAARAWESDERSKGELEEARRTVKEAERMVDKERAEKKSFVKLLGQSRAAEASLREELEAVTNAFEEVQGIQLQYKTLSRTIDELARRNALAEADVASLSDQNTDLLSHGNAHQRIRHVAQIRAELDASRRAHLTTTSSLALAQRENASLESELEAYRAVSSVPRSPSSATRSKLLRTSTSTLEDDYAGLRLGTLDERTFEDSQGDQRVPLEGDEEDEDGYEHVVLPPRASSVGGARRAGRAVVGERREGGSVRMHGKMSVSELVG